MMGQAANIHVYCDEDADLRLFRKLRDGSLLLQAIPEGNISLYPQISSARRRKDISQILPLFENDRPDLILTLLDRPILVIEMTEHAYTGDNGLQRFTRVAAAAENRVPFIYFGPISRVRDDEFDRTDDIASLSKRSLTSDFFEGMAALHSIYSVPQLFSEWITATNGKVMKAGPKAEPREYKKIYGKLVELIEALIETALATSGQRGPSESERILKLAQDHLLALAKRTNTKFSDVKFHFSPERTLGLIRSPEGILKDLGDYFTKGKPDKLLSLYALKHSSTKRILIHKKMITDRELVKSMTERICHSSVFESGSWVYYSGYKWRSDPHCGVAANIYFRKCVSASGKKMPLLLFYPRISIERGTTEKLIDESRNPHGLRKLFQQRYSASTFDLKLRKTISSRQLYHHWVGMS